MKKSSQYRSKFLMLARGLYQSLANGEKYMCYNLVYLYLSMELVREQGPSLDVVFLNITKDNSNNYIINFI